MAAYHCAADNGIPICEIFMHIRTYIYITIIVHDTQLYFTATHDR